MNVQKKEKICDKSWRFCNFFSLVIKRACWSCFINFSKSMCQKISENTIGMSVVKESLRKHKVFINNLPNRKIYIQASFHDAHCVTVLEKLPKKNASPDDTIEFFGKGQGTYFHFLLTFSRSKGHYVGSSWENSRWEEKS